MSDEREAEEMANELKAEKKNVEMRWTKRISFGEIKAADEEHLKEKVHEELNNNPSLREEEVDVWLIVNGDRVEFYP